MNSTLKQTDQKETHAMPSPEHPPMPPEATVPTTEIGVQSMGPTELAQQTHEWAPDDTLDPYTAHGEAAVKQARDAVESASERTQGATDSADTPLPEWEWGSSLPTLRDLKESANTKIDAAMIGGKKAIELGKRALDAANDAHDAVVNDPRVIVAKERTKAAGNKVGYGLAQPPQERVSRMAGEGLDHYSDEQLTEYSAALERTLQRVKNGEISVTDTALDSSDDTIPRTTTKRINDAIKLNEQIQDQLSRRATSQNGSPRLSERTRGRQLKKTVRQKKSEFAELLGTNNKGAKAKMKRAGNTVSDGVKSTLRLDNKAKQRRNVQEIVKQANRPRPGEKSDREQEWDKLRKKERGMNSEQHRGKGLDDLALEHRVRQNQMALAELKLEQATTNKERADAKKKISTYQRELAGLSHAIDEAEEKPPTDWHAIDRPHDRRSRTQKKVDGARERLATRKNKMFNRTEHQAQETLDSVANLDVTELYARQHELQSDIRDLRTAKRLGPIGRRRLARLELENAALSQRKNALAASHTEEDDELGRNQSNAQPQVPNDSSSEGSRSSNQNSSQTEQTPVEQSSNELDKVSNLTDDEIERKRQQIWDEMAPLSNLEQTHGRYRTPEETVALQELRDRFNKLTAYRDRYLDNSVEAVLRRHNERAGVRDNSFAAAIERHEAREKQRRQERAAQQQKSGNIAA